MKFLIGAVLVIAILFFEIISFPFGTDEEDIVRNITLLKKYQWFQDLLGNEAYKELIIHGNYVRKTIGKFNGSRLDNKLFRHRYHKKLQNALHQKLNRSV